MPPFKTILGSHLHMGEVCCCRYILLRFNKLKPISTSSAFRIWNNAMSVKYIADGGCGNIIAKVFHYSGDTVIAPRGITVCQSENLFDDFLADGFASALFLIFSGTVVFIGNQF